MSLDNINTLILNQYLSTFKYLLHLIQKGDINK